MSTTSSTASDGSATGRLIELLRALADPTRLRIVRLLEGSSQLPGSARSGVRGENGHGGDHGGLSVGELADILKLPQSTVSRHLKTLLDVGVVNARREGTSAFYRLLQESAEAQALLAMTRETLLHDPAARNDETRLQAVLRRREAEHNSADSFFGKHAPQWDQIRTQWFGDRFHLEGLLALLSPAWTVVDVGTGTGFMLPLIAPHVKQVIAVDPSQAMLRGARKRVAELGLTNVDIRQGKAERLPMENQTADVVLLTLVLAYTEEPAEVLAEARRVLRPGGVALVMDLQPHGVELFREKLNHRWMGFGREQMVGWMERAGFSGMHWFGLAAEVGRAKEAGSAGLPVPDLFAVRGVAARDGEVAGRGKRF